MQKSNIVWLASYPKSGNTWFRAFLSALLTDSKDIDINDLRDNNFFAKRDIFEAYTDLDSRNLYHSEVQELLPEVYLTLSDAVDIVQYFKVHQAYTFNSSGFPLIPPAATKAAIYFIRNPLDIAGSLANHMGKSIDEAIIMMNAPNSFLATQRMNLNIHRQLRQELLNWSLHVKSWTTKTEFPVLVIRFEDMLSNPFETFMNAVSFLGIDTSTEKVHQAIEATQFNKLREKEKLNGFREKHWRSGKFFRSGTKDNWKKELTTEQVQQIINCHIQMMKQYSYI